MQFNCKRDTASEGLEFRYHGIKRGLFCGHFASLNDFLLLSPVAISSSWEGKVRRNSSRLEV